MSSGVRPEKLKALKERMESLGIREEDISEKFVRSRGHGGQKVNKTSTCVYLKHIPTGIEVKCQESRSQPLNRFLARRLLADKIEQRLLGTESPAEKERQRIRRQKLRRKRRTRLKERQARQQ
ncbi:MAG TPA: peptide chain release factor-like protein [Nitrospirae bacterium]|nr:peptide chain release factor-like protein [Nitrospirota bacterium]